MKIKKLSVLGFKSFMDRHNVSFPPGISGVVGPNGCGKSNIVDAIRWCMGEQSPKQLRGRRMEVVIFNGAGEHKPMGMAEVSVVFENGDGGFPAPFDHDAELSVTRRLYRSGESDYMINNVPCRLKDIQEIFMDTGLGNRAYSIISQGQIGTIIEQRPEETRTMLEEAAGITKYRRKVETSYRKIEATEANLQRVEDILGEVQKQMRSLKRQAAKARRYKAISEEIQNLELRLYANSYRLYIQESGTKLKSTEDLVQQEVAASAKLSQHQAEIETMNFQLDEMDSDLSSRRSSHLQLLERIHKKEATLESLSGEVSMLEELEGRLREEHRQAGDRITHLGQEKNRLLESIEEMKTKAHGLTEEMDVCDRRLKGRRQLLKESKEVYEDARAKLNAGENKEVGLTHESSYIHKMLSQITDSRSRLENERTEVEEKIQTLQEASEKKRSAREAAAHKLEETEKAIQDHTRSNEELNGTREDLERELKLTDSELTACQSRLASLKALTDNFEGYKVGVRTIMKANDLEPRQQGRILGLVADMLQVDPRYEQAVEAVLADKLQYVIVESQEDGVKAVDYLKKRSRGRSSFVSLREVNGNGRPKPKDDHFPRLTEFVSVPEPYQPLMKALLGDTELVENLGDALSAWNSNGKDHCFVTPDGDMVDERGVISGGKLTQSSVGILGRKREIKELSAESARLQSRSNELNQKLDQILVDIRSKKDALQEWIDAKWSCQEEVNELDNVLFRLSQEMDQSERLLQKIRQDLERKGTEHHRHKQELQRIQQELQQCQVQRKQVEAYFQEKEKELRESEEEFDQLREEFAKLQSDTRILEEERRGLLREIERLDEHVEESVQRRQRIEEDIAAGKEKRSVCTARREEIRNDLQELYEKLKASEEELNAADRDRHEYQEKIRTEEEKADQLSFYLSRTSHF
jgi:chromosome segregation protein